MTAPSPIPGYSKAPRGLFVLPRVARVFTGTAISPSPPPRQWPSRSTIHAGRNLPDKGLRYLRHFVTPQAALTATWVGRSFLPTSACRHADRTISYPTFRQGFRRMVSGDSEDLHANALTSSVFPADYPHRTRCHQPLMMSGQVAPDTRASQHIARFYNGLKLQSLPVRPEQTILG